MQILRTICGVVFYFCFAALFVIVRVRQTRITFAKSAKDKKSKEFKIEFKR